MTRLRDHPDWVPLLFDNNGTPIPLDLDAPPEKREPRSDKPRRERFGTNNYGGQNNQNNLALNLDMWALNPYAAGRDEDHLLVWTSWNSNRWCNIVRERRRTGSARPSGRNNFFSSQPPPSCTGTSCTGIRAPPEWPTSWARWVWGAPVSPLWGAPG